VGRLGDRKLCRRPHDLTLRLRANLETDVGAGEAEVIELLGIDLGELFRVDGSGQVAGGRGRGLSRVVPACESHDPDKSPEVLRHRVNLQRVHSWTPPISFEFITCRCRLTASGPTGSIGSSWSM